MTTNKPAPLTPDELEKMRAEHAIHSWTWSDGKPGAYCTFCHRLPGECHLTRLLGHIDWQWDHIEVLCDWSAKLARERDAALETVEALADVASEALQERDADIFYVQIANENCNRMDADLAAAQTEARQARTMVARLARLLVQKTCEYQNACPECGFIVDWHDEGCIVGQSFAAITPPRREQRRRYVTDRPCVSVDPGIQFGQPCLHGTRIPAYIIAQQYIAGGLEYVCQDYEITKADVLVCCYYIGQYNKGCLPKKLRQQWFWWSNAFPLGKFDTLSPPPRVVEEDG